MVLSSKIFIVSSSQATSPLWVFKQPGLRVILEHNPANVLERWAELLPDLIVLDIDVEGLALQVISSLREESILPILLLTFVRSQQFVLDVYAAGVDECILKPISPALFHAKIKAWLRRSGNIPLDILASITIGEFHLVPANRSLQRAGSEPIHLTNLELRLLYYFMGRPGHTITTDELCERVWGPANESDATTLKNLVYRLRRKIEANPAHPRYILTVPGVGYKFVAT